MSGNYLETNTATWAVRSAQTSGLPGYHNGPADAYRHILAVAEAARVYGTLPAWAAGEANETPNAILGIAPAAGAMDRYNNNEIALRIARMAQSREDVERLAQAEIVAGTGATEPGPTEPRGGLPPNIGGRPNTRMRPPTGRRNGTTKTSSASSV